MNIRPHYFLSIALSYCLFISCDTTTNPQDLTIESPVVLVADISPPQIQFDSVLDGFRDTTVAITISATIENVSDDVVPGYVIRDKETGALINSGDLQVEGINGYVGEANLKLTTTSFEEYIVEVFAYDEFGTGNYFQKNLSVIGFSNNKPVILEAINESEIVRPASGQVTAFFTAKVTDDDGQASIDRVLMRIIDLVAGEPEESPYLMFDDGASLGDVVANDSVFTFSLPVTQTDNRPNRDFNIEYFAIDKGGLISDTVRTTFRIVE